MFPNYCIFLFVLFSIIRVSNPATMELFSSFIVSILESKKADFVLALPFELRDLGFGTTSGIGYRLNDGIFGNSTILVFPRIPKFGNRFKVCLVVVESQNDLGKWERTLSPNYFPLVRKDSDFWIIWAKEEKMLDSILLKSKAKYVVGIAKKSSTLSTLQIRSLCQFCDEGKPKIINHNEGNLEHLFNDYTRNLYGHTIRVSFPIIRPMVEAYPNLAINNGKRGIWVNLFDEYYVPKLNCTYNMFLSPGKGTGLKLPNGTWIGTTGDVANGLADVGVVTGQSFARRQVVGFTESFIYITYLHFITANGEAVYSPMALLWPFTAKMWMAIVASTVVAMGVIQLINRSIPFLHSGKREGEKQWELRDQIYFLLSSYLDQDCRFPTFTPLRTFAALWLFFALILTTVYRSKMVSLLAFPLIEKTPQTLAELVGRRDYKIGFIKHGDAAYNVIKSSKDPTYVKLVKEMEIITNDGLECLENVVSTKYACFGFAVSTSYLIAANLSDADLRKLKTAPEMTYCVYLGLAVVPGSILSESFDHYLRWVRPFHLVYIWDENDRFIALRASKRTFWAETNQTEKLNPATSEDDESNLHLTNVLGAFYILLLLSFLSALCFLDEMFIFKVKGRMERARKWKKAKTGLTFLKPQGSEKVKWLR